ncbi:MAG: sorbosone dehydrogenase family protein [Chitinophagaceae bacterium]
MKKIIGSIAVISVLIVSCKNNANRPEPVVPAVTDTVKKTVTAVPLAAPFATPSVKKYSQVEGWPKGKVPTVSAFLQVTLFADSLDNPRWIYVADNGDIFVAEANSAHSTLEKITGKNKNKDDIILLRDTNGDGRADDRTVFLKDLNKPFGMLAMNNQFYVANTDAVVSYPYFAGAAAITARGKKILDLPGGPRHWTRNLITNADHSKIYVSVGSSTDHGENGPDKEKRRACILEITPDGNNEKIFASGLRNPVGMDWLPGTNELWSVVNERDELGDELVPDYLTSVTEGNFYGWPWLYYGNHPDPRVKDYKQPAPSTVATMPDLSLENHTASLGLKFYTGNKLPAHYKGGAIITQHGSWNKSTLAGYKVIFVPFKDKRPSGPAEDFVTGFIDDPATAKVFGRPVGIAIAKDGAVLIADDASGKIWRVTEKVQE